MSELSWSASEKKIARRAYDLALASRLRKLMTEFKAKAAAAAVPSDMWAIEEFLRWERHELDDTFDYRYSRLPLVFALLVREGYLDEAQLRGLAEEDRDFAGTGVATWSTPNLMCGLAEATRART
jgi:photoprotection regulator FRP-like protein